MTNTSTYMSGNNHGHKKIFSNIARQDKMAEIESTEELEELNCPVCCGQFVDPKMLMCGHTFCRACLQGVLSNGGRLRCPECRAEDPRVSVDQLPTNFTISRILNKERPTQIVSSKGPKTSKCPVCHQNTYLMQCLHCQKNVCENCRQKHTENMKTDVLKLVETFKTEFSQEQSSHDQVQTADGATINENSDVINHQDSLSSSEPTTSQDESSKINSASGGNFALEVESQMTISTQDEATEHTSIYQRNSSIKINKNVKTVTNQIDEETDRLIRCLEERRQHLKDNVADMAKIERIEISKRIQKLLKRQEDIQEYCHKCSERLENLSNPVNHSELYTFLEQLKKYQVDYNQLKTTIDTPSTISVSCNTAPIMSLISQFGDITSISNNTQTVQNTRSITSHQTQRPRPFRDATDVFLNGLSKRHKGRRN